MGAGEGTVWGWWERLEGRGGGEERKMGTETAEGLALSLGRGLGGLGFLGKRIRQGVVALGSDGDALGGVWEGSDTAATPKSMKWPRRAPKHPRFGAQRE